MWATHSPRSILRRCDKDEPNSNLCPKYSYSCPEVEDVSKTQNTSWSEKPEKHLSAKISVQLDKEVRQHLGFHQPLCSSQRVTQMWWKTLCHIYSQVISLDDFDKNNMLVVYHKMNLPINALLRIDWFVPAWIIRDTIAVQVTSSNRTSVSPGSQSWDLSYRLKHDNSIMEGIHWMYEGHFAVKPCSDSVVSLALSPGINVSIR